jgi:orotidine-5'-phosphate decarboxylase
MADVIVALDFPSRRDALAMADRLGDAAGFYKVGLELYTRAGPDVVRELRARGKRVFLDLKLNDIPNTVAGAVRAAAELEVDLVTVHTTGGAEMLRAAAAAAENRLALLGVTLLTSLSPADVETTWARPISSLREEVVRLATLARESGLPGIVASPQEAEAVRRRLGPDLVIVTPGIRLPGGDAHDQSRIATPGEAARAGATYLVIGRPVTTARDPVAVLASVRADLDTVGV